MKHMAELLLEDTYYTVSVIFSDTKDWENSIERRYTYKVSNELELTAGDIVIVIAGGEYKFVRVVEVHEENQIDYESNYNYSWIVQKLDLTMHKALIAKDREVRKVVKETEKQSKKNQIMETFRSNMDEAALALFDDKVKKLGSDV